ncbi:MAG: hypothetical protein ACI4MP_04345 [Candidatus Ventricola sp.]
MYESELRPLLEVLTGATYEENLAYLKKLDRIAHGIPRQKLVSGANRAVIL